MTRICTVANCEKAHYAKELCKKHYQRFQATGTADLESPLFRDPEESFRHRAGNPDDRGCMPWGGNTNRYGYGIIRAKGKDVGAHRYAWERANGPIPAGRVVDHTCWNRKCVNVDHLRVVTHAENLQNRKGARAGTRSGIRGVIWNSSRGQWQVQVRLDGKAHYGGTFSNKEDAGRAASELRSQLLPYSQN